MRYTRGGKVKKLKSWNFNNGVTSASSASTSSTSTSSSAAWMEQFPRKRTGRKSNRERYVILPHYKSITARSQSNPSDITRVLWFTVLLQVGLKSSDQFSFVSFGFQTSGLTLLPQLSKLKQHNKQRFDIHRLYLYAHITADIKIVANKIPASTIKTYSLYYQGKLRKLHSWTSFLT